jgi:hypothetical protein
MSAPTPDATDVRVFVNERRVDVPLGTTALDAVRALDPDEATRVATGARAIVDSRGLPAAPDAAVYAGAIYRTIAARQADRE